MIPNSTKDSSLASMDPHISDLIQQEFQRMSEGLELIASENYTSPAILEAQGSILTNKYAEGYPAHRYYGGCHVVDQVEQLAIHRACQLFQSPAANVQPHSGSQANMAVYLACLKPKDRILGMDLSQGGHLTHGSPVNFSGRLFEVFSYGVHPTTHRIDYDQIRDLVKKVKPHLIIAGASAYPRTLDFEIFGQIAQEAGIPWMADIAHIAGLVAAGLHPSPLPWATYTTTTTHKTLRGPRGGLILCGASELQAVNRAIFPGTQGGPLMHTIAAKAVCFHEAQQPDFKIYQQNILKNAQALAHALMETGLELITQGTDNHLMLVNLTPLSMTGQQAEQWLDQAGITVNKNTIPQETQRPWITSGIRIGVPALTTRGLGVNEMKQIALWIHTVLTSQGDHEKLEKIRLQVKALCQQFPIDSFSPRRETP